MAELERVEVGRSAFSRWEAYQDGFFSLAYLVAGPCRKVIESSHKIRYA